MINQIDEYGQRHGFYQHEYPHGYLWCECNYIHGKINGLCKDYHMDNSTIISFYNLGIVEGEKIDFFRK